MKKTNSTMIAFVMLFAFCGQVLATSFLDCCEGMGEASAISSSTSSSSSPVSSNTEQTDMEHHHNHSNSNMLMDNDVGFAIDFTDCNHQCDFCLGTASTLIQEPAAYNPQSALFTNPSHYQFLQLASNSDNPFRPPISA